MMNTLRIPYLESLPALANQSKEEFEQEARLALAYKLYEMGRLTSGRAASLGGVSRVQFCCNLPALVSPVLSGTQKK
jgi:hypothetical protein